MCPTGVLHFGGIWRVADGLAPLMNKCINLNQHWQLLLDPSLFLKETKEAIRNHYSPLLNWKSDSEKVWLAGCLFRSLRSLESSQLHTQTCGICIDTCTYWMTVKQIVWELHHSFLVPGHPSLAFPTHSHLDDNPDSHMHLCKHKRSSAFWKTVQIKHLKIPMTTTVHLHTRDTHSRSINVSHSQDVWHNVHTFKNTRLFMSTLSLGFDFEHIRTELIEFGSQQLEQCSAVFTILEPACLWALIMLWCSSG